MTCSGVCLALLLLQVRTVLSQLSVVATSLTSIAYRQQSQRLLTGKHVCRAGSACQWLHVSGMVSSSVTGKHVRALHGCMAASLHANSSITSRTMCPFELCPCASAVATWRVCVHCVRVCWCRSGTSTTSAGRTGSERQHKSAYAHHLCPSS